MGARSRRRRGALGRRDRGRGLRAAGAARALSAGFGSCRFPSRRTGIVAAGAAAASPQSRAAGGRAPRDADAGEARRLGVRGGAAARGAGVGPTGRGPALPCPAAAARAPGSRRADAPGPGCAGAAASRPGLRRCGGVSTLAPEAPGAAAAASGREPAGGRNYTGSGSASRAAPEACGEGRGAGAAALQVGVGEPRAVSSQSSWGESHTPPFHGPFPSPGSTFFCLVRFGIGVSAAFVAASGPEGSDLSEVVGKL